MSENVTEVSEIDLDAALRRAGIDPVAVTEHRSGKSKLRPKSRHADFQPTKPGRGGARAGAGRPKTPEALLRARNTTASRTLPSAETGSTPTQDLAAGSTGAPVESRDCVALGEQYALDIVSGKIPAGKYTRKACERHLRDIARQSTPEFPYVFDRDKANTFCANGEQYPHIKGKWAAKKLRLHWEAWQCFSLMQFGWVHVVTRMRRFNEFYEEIPRKNAKSTMAAAIGNNQLLFDDEHMAEVYAGATSEKQAWEVFGPARQMLKDMPKAFQDKHFLEILHKSIVKASDASRFWPLIGKPGDGASPSCAIVDEYHEHDTSDLVDTMVTGMGAREQPVLFIITTSGTNLASPCHDKHKEAQRLLDGLIVNERMFAIIYHADIPEGDEKGDDWTDPLALRKANPNMGVSVDEEYLLAQQRNAVLNPAYQNRFKTKHLNIWCNASVAGINMHSWRLCSDAGLRLEEFEGMEAWLILDLASKTDICAHMQLFQKLIKDKRHYYAFGKYYLPEDTIEEAKHNKQTYRKWVTQGYLTSTPGAEIDFNKIEEDVKEMSKRFQTIEVVYDPWRATQLAHGLTAAGATCVEVGQTAKNLGSAFDELLSAIKGGRFHHDGNPVLEWMASNTLAKTVVKGLVVPAKDKVEQKIDGIVAIVMGISRAQAREPSGAMEDFFSNPVTAG